MDLPPIELLKKVDDRTLDLTGENVWKALHYRAFIQVLDKKGNVVSGSPKLKEIVGFRLTHRGKALLKNSGPGAARLPFNRDDLPINERLWVSAFRRWCRNCPKGLQLTYSDSELHVLATDTSGKVADDDLHRIASMKVPWYLVK